MTNNYSVIANLSQNTLITTIGNLSKDDEHDAVDRVIWLDEAEGLIGVIEVTNSKALPRIERLSKVELGLEDRSIRVLEVDPWLASPILSFQFGNEEPSKEEIKKIEKIHQRYDLVAPVFEKYERALFSSGTRGKVVNSIVASGILTKPTILKYMRSYFQKGMTVNAFVTDHDRCGGPGKTRAVCEKKRGRPISQEKLVEGKPGINIDVISAQNLADGYDEFHVKGKKSLKKAWKKTLNKFWCIGYRLNKGIHTPVLPDMNTIPSIDQFKYWGVTGRNKRLDSLMGLKRKEIMLNRRESLGSARSGINGPGDEYQVDATLGLVHLVARDNPGLRIQKAIVYAIIDTYSQLVVGWSVALEHAHYSALAIALERAFTSKVDACARLNISITHDEWPADTVCSVLLGDKGAELMGYQSDNACKALGFEFASTSTGRADLKPYIERFFGNLKDELKTVPGATKGPKKRAEDNEAENACINLDEFEEIVVMCILQFNSTHKVRDHVDEIHLIAEGLALTPINFFDWGRKNRSGSGKRFSREYIRAALLPKELVTAKRDGIAFQGLRYASEKLTSEGAFLRQTNMKFSQFIIGYDPRNLSEIWVFDKKGRVSERCQLTKKYAHMSGLSLWELKAIRKASAPVKVSAIKKEAEEWCGLDSKMKKMIQKAKKAKAETGTKKSKFCDASRRWEQEARRQEEAWTGSATQETSNQPKVNFKYVAGANYLDDDDHE